MTKLLGGMLVLAGALIFVPGASAQVSHVAALEAKGARADKPRVSDAQIRTILIEQSIAAYSGNCPCPYSTARNGSRCGRRSAYSREGGAEPLCYPKDVSAAMVKEYREANPQD
jgi:hypothetical protein